MSMDPVCPCGVTNPDQFGNRELIPHTACPLHGNGTGWIDEHPVEPVFGGWKMETSDPAHVRDHHFKPRGEWWTLCRRCGLAESAHLGKAA